MSETFDEPLHEPPRKRRRRFLVVLLLLLAITSAWWGKLVLSQLAFFRIREVEVTGTHFLDPATVVARMRVDTLRSIWNETDSYRYRVESHPQVTSAAIERKLPSKLVVHVQENLPIALIPTATGFLTYDSTGHELPIDARLAAPDLPIVARPDTAILSLLGRIRSYNPFVFERISEISRPSPNEFLILLAAGERKSSSAPSDSSALD
nr:FtsQ-type POTRA domain-containing protein [Gemmatimonadaceae bacterium]